MHLVITFVLFLLVSAGTVFGQSVNNIYIWCAQDSPQVLMAEWNGEPQNHTVAVLCRDRFGGWGVYRRLTRGISGLDLRVISRGFGQSQVYILGTTGVIRTLSGPTLAVSDWAISDGDAFGNVWGDQFEIVRGGVREVRQYRINGGEIVTQRLGSGRKFGQYGCASFVRTMVGDEFCTASQWLQRAPMNNGNGTVNWEQAQIMVVNNSMGKVATDGNDVFVAVNVEYGQSLPMVCPQAPCQSTSTIIQPGKIFRLSRGTGQPVVVYTDRNMPYNAPMTIFGSKLYTTTIREAGNNWDGYPILSFDIVEVDLATGRSTTIHRNSSDVYTPALIAVPPSTF